MADATTGAAPSGPSSIPPTMPASPPVQAAAAPPPSPGAGTSTTAYVAGSSYDVTLNRVVEWPKGSGIVYSPRDHHIMTGAVCLEIADGIADAKQV